MKVVQYEDVPGICSQLLSEVEIGGITVEVWKDGKPIARMMPVDDATRSQFETVCMR